MRTAMNNSSISKANKSAICEELYKKINEEENEEEDCHVAELR